MKRAFVVVPHFDRFVRNADALNLLKTGGAAFFEIGDSQGEAVLSLMRDFGFSGAKVEKDFSGRCRYAMACL